MRINKYFFYTGITIGFIGLLFLLFYRPYIYENQLFDFHFADTLGSIFCIPTLAFVNYGFSKKDNFVKIFLNVNIFCITYEMIDSISRGIDIYDY
jgi:hypothetical protein